MTLIEKQNNFATMVAMLILHAQKIGYRVTLGESYRTPEQAAANAKKGNGISNSLHCIRLAIDLNVFIGSELLTNGAMFEDLGRYWESIGGAWGGRFKDGNHFSLEHNGTK